MKLKKMLAILLALGILTVFTACQADDTAADQGGSVDETVETPEENEETDSPAAEDATGETAPDAPETTDPTEPETDAPEADAVTVTLYTGNDNADNLDEEEITLDELTPDALLDALIKAEAIPEQTVCNSFEQSADGTSLTLDLTAAFGDGVRQMGTAGESMILGSLTNTFLDAYGAEQLMLTIDGAPLETGHNVYDEPLERVEFTVVE